MSERTVRIAAIGDLHFDPQRRGAMTELFDRVNRESDVLTLLGDLTTHGQPEQIEAFIRELESVDVPVIAVLGNHDHEAAAADRICELLGEAGITVLDGTSTVVEGIGFAGIKGFAGGFGRAMLGPFGEPLIKAFVQEAVDEALKLETALRELDTEERIVLTHYSPIPGTLEGEPEQIYTFLGSSRILEPIDTFGASVVFHGHAHHGSYRGETPGGVPVFNVSVHVLEAEGIGLHIHEVRAPDRREGDARQGGRRAPEPQAT